MKSMPLQADEVLRMLLAECGAEALHGVMLAQGYDLFTAARITTEVRILVRMRLRTSLLGPPDAPPRWPLTHAQLTFSAFCLSACPHWKQQRRDS